MPRRGFLPPWCHKDTQNAGTFLLVGRYGSLHQTVDTTLPQMSGTEIFPPNHPMAYTQTRLETAVWTTLKPHSPQPSCAELVIPPQERRIPGRGWSGDARTEAELQAATDAMHTAWQRLRMDTRDAQLRRAVRKACNWLKRVRSAAVVRFFERHVIELEKQLRMGDQHGFFQNIKSVQLEETKKVE